MKLLIDFDPIKQHSKITCDQPITPNQMVLVMWTTVIQVILSKLDQKEDRRIMTPEGGLKL